MAAEGVTGQRQSEIYFKKLFIVFLSWQEPKTQLFKSVLLRIIFSPPPNTPLFFKNFKKLFFSEGRGEREERLTDVISKIFQFDSFIIHSTCSLYFTIYLMFTGVRVVMKSRIEKSIYVHCEEGNVVFAISYLFYFKRRG